MRRLLWAVFVLGTAGAPAMTRAQDAVCGQGGCGASGVAPSVLKEAVRQARVDPEPARGKRQERGASPAPLRDPWERQLGGGAGEDYNCLLSFGIGGSTGKDGFLATRLLGRTQVWRPATPAPAGD